MNRQYVHLSADIPTAEKVGRRRKGETAVLTIRAEDYYREGGIFYRADNGVWLTEALPAEYIEWTEVLYLPAQSGKKIK